MLHLKAKYYDIIAYTECFKGKRLSNLDKSKVPDGPQSDRIQESICGKSKEMNYSHKPNCFTATLQL